MKHISKVKGHQLFTVMLWAFIAVIVLGVGGMAVLYTISGGWEAHSPSLSEQIGPTGIGPTFVQPVTYRPAPEWRGVLSAVLALAAVLLGVSTFFSSRVSRPITRLTKAARTMASGDLGVRVQACAIRELNELADAFNSMASSLAQSDLQRRQMTADVAHELRTPLSIIRGRLEGIQDGVYPATPDQISSLLSETAILERLIEDLRLLALADAGQMPLYIDTFPPGQLLTSVAHSFAHEAEAQAVTLQVLVQPGMPEVQADPQRLAQVLGNLVSNSLRHTPSGGTITMEVWTDIAGMWPQVRMAVTDTGAGIRQEDLPFVFDRFWKADKARSRGSGGAGLGLAIAKRIVEAHGGHIWAAGGPQGGTTVAFTIPQTTVIPAPIPRRAVPVT